MRTAEYVRQYLKGVDYPAGPPELHVAGTQNDAPPSFVELLGHCRPLPSFTISTRSLSSWSA